MEKFYDSAASARKTSDSSSSSTHGRNGGQEHSKPTLPIHSTSGSPNTHVHDDHSGSSNHIPAGLSVLRQGEEITARTTSQDAMKVQSSLSAHQGFPHTQEPLTSTSVYGAKRKRLHVDAHDCSDMAQSGPGAMALKNPTMIRTTLSRNSNYRGLYPRPPRPSHSQGTVPFPSSPGFSSGPQKRNPSQITLRKDQMKDQTRMDQYFPISRCKKATPTRASPEDLHQQSQPALSGSITAPTTFPKKNLNAQFAPMAPTQLHSDQDQRPRRIITSVTSVSLPAGTALKDKFLPEPAQQIPQRREPAKTNFKLSHFSPKVSSQSLPPAKIGHPYLDKASTTVAHSSLGSCERTPTKMYCSPIQLSPSPAKSEKSTTESDIEDFQNDNSWEGFGEKMALTPPTLGSNVINSLITRSPENVSTPTKIFPKSRQSPSPAKSTTQCDIEDFQNDISWEGFEFDQVSSLAPPDPSPSESGQGIVEHDIKAFENDSFFDNIDPGFLTGESIPSQASSQASSSSCPNTFGLLGEGGPPADDEEPPFQAFSSLPLEVLERVFCFVPMMDLCLHLSPVCKLWHGIISNEDFIPWKKTYHRLRMTSLMEVAEQLNCITHDQMESEDTCLLDLIRNMPNFKARCGPTMDKDLQKHHMYVLAKDLMKAKAPEVLHNGEPNPWSTIALLAILSETVQDVFHILDCLLHRTASCTTMEVLECLYCTASYLWKYKIRFKLNSGLHYRVYHALYLFENSHSCVDVAPEDQSVGQGMLDSHPLSFHRHRLPATHEQSRIINYDVAKGKVVKIVAFAGTGKTTTLVKYAERRPDTSFLYVAFNKSVMQYAKEIFPSNVTSRTTHSLAYEAIGCKYHKKLETSFNPFHIHKVLPQAERKKLPWLRYASLVCKTLERFCASADEFITTQHVPEYYMKDTQRGSVVVVERHVLEHALRMKISNDATFVWDQMIIVKNMEAHITHDVYLKLYQLSKPWHMEYDCLLIDEAQDLTPAQQDILLNQGCAKILVGDPHQQIYSFRGATDAMNRISSERTFYLTQSFRFGAEIAYISNCLLEKGMRDVANMRQMLIGNRQPDCIDGRETGRLAIVTRNNVTLFNEAVRIVQADTTTMLAFAGGIDRFRMDVILDIYQLMQPQNKRERIINSHIWMHKNFYSLKTYSNETNNGELLNKIKIVETYNVSIPELVEKIRSRSRHQSVADVVLSTAHAAKGLEFDTVKITDDFGICETKLTPLSVLGKDELNMVYVAVTRAKKSLVLTGSLMAYISGLPSLEKFAYPVPGSSSRGQEEAPSACVACQEAIPNNCAVLLKKKAFKLAYPSVTKHGGLLCPRCSVELYPAYRCFFEEEHLELSQE